MKFSVSKPINGNEWSSTWILLKNIRTGENK
jgi:hypothetical protein